jgi:regulatory protein
MDRITLEKIRKYCAYQERCHDEVKQKLKTLGVYGLEAEAMMLALIESNFLNEERFACAYAGGKFRTKKWGRLRIVNELKRRHISAYCIQKGLKEISDGDYRKTLLQLIEKNWKQQKESKIEIRRNLVAKALMRKGYEPELTWAMVQDFEG